MRNVSPRFTQKSKPLSTVERMGAFARQVRLRKERGNYRLKWIVLDGRRLKLSVRQIATVLEIPVGRVEQTLETMRNDAR